jgi:Fungal Zn(2)-Cys(6) binuclear cluster domain
MKRNTDADKQRGSNPSRNQTKRSKSAQACSSCRKLKTRCELLDASSAGPYRCHRCKVLNISCSFEGLYIAPARPHYQLEPVIPPPNLGSADSHENAQQSSSSSLKAASTSENHVDPMKPDVLAQPPNISWPGLVKVPGGPFHWMATPMFAMQNITSRMESGEDLFMTDVNTSLANILGQERLKLLLNM